MRVIRVKEQNQAAIIAALSAAGYTAEPAQCPASEQGYEWATDYPSRFKEIINQDTLGMTGIRTTASGNKAHGVIDALKAQGIIN